MQATSDAAIGTKPVLAPPRKKSYLKANVATVLAIAVAATAAWITAMTYVQAYGIGATHYGQSADIAKRTGPDASLFVLDALALVIVVVLARVAIRGFRSPR
jgi:hypothetical protein